MRVKIVDQETKEPVKGAEIHVYSLYPKRKIKIIAKGITDDQGIVELFPELEGEGVVELKTGGDPNGEN